MGLMSVGAGPRAKLLWTNPNPTVSFSPQKVSVDLSGYDAVYIVPCNSAKLTLPGTMCLVGEGGQITQAYYELTGRPFTVSDSGVTFQQANKTLTYALATQPDNTKAIPYLIYGIKL